MTSLRSTTEHRGAAGEIETFAMANCLMLLSSQQSAGGYDSAAASDHSRMFSCKTCGRKFPSFQALGGHRASHNKNKPATVESPAPSKPKTHACSICGLEFPIGQALGGHMRRHRSAISAAGSTITSEGSVEKIDGGDGAVDKKRKIDDVLVTMPSILKKSNSCKRICFPLELNLNFLPWTEDKKKNSVKVEDEIQEGEIVEEEVKRNVNCEERNDFLKLELRPPINHW